MTHANGFRRRSLRWCWPLLAVAAALALPGTEIVYGQSLPDNESPQANKLTPKPAAGMAAAPGTEPARMTDAIRLRNVAATDMANTINRFFEKKQGGKNVTDQGQAETPTFVAEPASNHLLVSAGPRDLAEIKRLVAVLDIAPRQYFVEVTVCEGEPLPTVREAAEKGKVNVLACQQLLTLEHQTALINTGSEVEFPAGSAQKRMVGVMLQVTVGPANDKQVPVRIVSEVSSLSRDPAALDMYHVEQTANYPLGEAVRMRGGKTKSGKELWSEVTITQVTSREQLQKLKGAAGRSPEKASPQSK